MYETIAFPTAPKNRPNYRIPSVVRAANGDLLAFAERRQDGPGDIGRNEMVVRRSTDLGRTWSADIDIYKENYYANSDPTPLVDSKARIWLFFTLDRKEIVLTFSDDHGATWSKIKSIHAQVIPQEWNTYHGSTNNLPAGAKDHKEKIASWEKDWKQRFGVGCGAAAVEVREGKFAGRIVVPARATVETPGNKGMQYSFAFMSDDRGQTWHRGQLAIPFGCECEIVELAGGVLMMNSRDGDNHNRPDHFKRRIATSDDGGESWKDVHEDSQLINPQTHAALKRYTFGGQDLLLFTTPANPVREEKHPYGRRNLSMQISRDQGKTWSRPQTIYPHASSYSEIVILEDGTIGVIYERGAEGSVNYWDEVAFARFKVDWGKW